MTVSVISFNGPALDWYRSQEEREKFKNCSDLKRRLLERFHSIREGSIYGRFFAIKQTSTVEEYQNLFDNLVAPLTHLSDRVLEETFMNGLVPWIRAEVEYSEPKGLVQMMRLVQKAEVREIIRREANLSGYSGTMKVRGKIHGEVVVLIDCGATHNFISEKLVASLKLHTKETSNYGVILGSGATVKGKGVCKKVALLSWGYGKDWKNLIMTFIHDNKKSLVKTWTNSDQGYLIECRSLEAIMPQIEIQEEVPETEEAVKTVLSKYQDVFD
ncbi:transposon Tf2-1 polyprotein isoform X1 [Cucumis melo var. makuwa]|uniref:Transposon Tf2-1 polyprotein isoform X1 n=1 Tax=Cucumis melo var. makuwa TaxID=1194695 RepID=A0A5D3DZ73_CUCMM|nr:transposon Tf2-1 polyprotein isoform X1 [Cucumis melo var. makuwa]